MQLKILLENATLDDQLRKNFIYIILGIVLVVPILFIFKTSLGIKGVILLLGFAVGMLTLYSYTVSFYVLLLLLFTPNFIAYHTAVFFTAFLFFSFLVSYKGESKADVLSPLIYPFLIYLITTIPSLINTPNLLFSIIGEYHLIAFAILFITIAIRIDSHKRILNVIYFFLFGVGVHSIIVIFLGLSSGERVFGLLDVFYVDFAGLGGIISFILLVYLKGSKKVLAGVLFITITFGLVLTQTRNAWLSFAVSFISLVIYLLFKGPKLNIQRTSIISNAFASLLIIGAIFIFAGNITSDIQERFDSKAQTGEVLDQDPNSIVENSFVTRLFIWHTAINAFMEHPYIGVGAYSFPVSSKQYYKIPRPFYETFVQNRTSHVTFLSVLTETGIIGFIGFIFFLVANLKLFFKNLKLVREKSDIMRTLIICWVFVYMSASMFMTDAWLFGQQILIWGIFLGLLLSNFGILSTKSEKSNA